MSDDILKWLENKAILNRYEKIRIAVTGLHKAHEAKPQLKWYTPHGESHYLAVENRIFELIPSESNDPSDEKPPYMQLTESERFFLLTSAWIHDIGMIRGIFSNDELLNDDQIREDHHIRSEKFIVNNYSSLSIEEKEAVVFGLLARYHRRRCFIDECPEEITISGHGNIRVKLLAAYLRLADALHIDQTRVPAYSYAITLAYNIPIHAKIHWLRGMFVIGVKIDISKKMIILSFKSPIELDSDENNDSITIALERTLETIYDVIIQDLTSELDTVKEVLVYAGITYFLVIKKQMVKVQFNDQLKNDINTVLNYYFLMDNPSSSALYRMVLESIKGIITSSKQEGSEWTSLVNNFLKEINDRILKTRQCHTGLKRLVEEIIKKKEESTRIGYFEEYINERESNLLEERRKIRESAILYFETEILLREKEKDHTYNILLYGFSELVIKSLCGFRDAVIIQKLDNEEFRKNPTLIRKELEGEASKKFRIFICEAQPKNRTGWGGKIFYYDALGYSQSLIKRGFKEVYIIPDAIAGTLLFQQFLNVNNIYTSKTPNIDFVMVGANGFDKLRFRHSAGHAMIAGLTKFTQVNNNDSSTSPPVFILCLLTNKFDKDGLQSKDSDDKDSDDNEENIIMNNGWRFKNSFYNEPVRNNIFVSQDANMKRILTIENKGILFYNPREDVIPINLVDIVICEKGFLQNSDGNLNGDLIVSDERYDKRR